MDTVIEAIYFNSRKYGNKLCCADEYESMGYFEFYENISKAASFLKYKGVKSGAVVLICGFKTVNFMIAFYAVQSLGAIACPVKKNISEKQVVELCDQMNTSWCLGKKKAGFSSLDMLDFDEMRHWNGHMDSEWFLYCYNSPTQISNIIFTTGTTGESKGIEISHRADMAIAENIITGVKMVSEDVELITTPFNHSLTIRRMSALLVKGASVVLTDSYMFPNIFFGLMDQYHVTAVTFVPAILKIVLMSFGERLADYNKVLNYIQLGSAPLLEEEKQELIKLLPNVRLYNMYGSTESGCSTIFEFSKYQGKKGCIGHPTANTRIFFVDESGNQKESNCKENAGRMVFCGKMNMSGYYNAPGLTEQVLKNGAIYSNDIGYMGADGFVYFIGRIDDIINMGGVKINPLEVEEAALMYSGVKDCMCAPEPDDMAGELPVLYVVKEETYKISDQKLRKFLCTKLDPEIVPKKVVFTEQIPRTFNGKIVRRINTLND